ncbi:uncharacterized protein CC84DRAFT_1211115 [Paraphaeosphaeria sporulosa]|uniref:Uncharacterized protein n=1 Tax=Paraphaeosphaeria sporulosa TaxID=1460663 RepID=A0A177CXL5_9PLEO|nr:uncharacterized protein CC84DRAFT_1211115 [Paraphaeosphaeria sporulosa]OAG11459.1 hypothetical protein CC84DRAFT_1211115 [Paraphaeosphaeria sporulosa]
MAVINAYVIMIMIFIYLVSTLLRSCLDIMRKPSPNPGPESVQVLVYRIPSGEGAPHPVRLPTTSEPVAVYPGAFPAHIPDVFRYWTLRGVDRLLYRDWTVTQLKSYPIENDDGLYMTIYCWGTESGMRQNHNVPKILRPIEVMYGDVFIAKLSHRQCGCSGHGWAEYADVQQYYLQRVFEKDRVMARVEQEMKNEWGIRRAGRYKSTAQST